VNEPHVNESLDEWVLALCRELDVDPAVVPVAALLDVSRDVAHSVMRPATPVSTFVIGLAAARAGGHEAAVLRAIETARALALAWSQGEPLGD